VGAYGKSGATDDWGEDNWSGSFTTKRAGEGGGAPSTPSRDDWGTSDGTRDGNDKGGQRQRGAANRGGGRGKLSWDRRAGRGNDRGDRYNNNDSNSYSSSRDDRYGGNNTNRVYRDKSPDTRRSSGGYGTSGGTSYSSSRYRGNNNDRFTPRQGGDFRRGERDRQQGGKWGRERSERNDRYGRRGSDFAGRSDYQDGFNDDDEYGSNEMMDYEGDYGVRWVCVCVGGCGWVRLFSIPSSARGSHLSKHESHPHI